MSALQQESDLLLHFQKLNSRNPKKIVKLAKRLIWDVEHECQRKFCIDIIEALDPVKYLDFCVQRIHDFAIIMEEEIAAGNHGVMFVGKDGDIIYPIKLDTLPNWLKQTDKWTEEDEHQIMMDAATAYMHANNRYSLRTKIVLFPQFGFSGMARMLNVELSRDLKLNKGKENE